MDKMYVTVKEHFPQFVQADYPAFVAFVQAYYKWLEQYSIDKIEHLVDIDETAEQFVKYFKRQLDVYGIYADADPIDIKYIKRIKEVYSSKGSEQSLVFLLKTVYGSDDNTKIVYPRDSILRASDGVWDQERFITVRKYFGNVPPQVTTLLIEYQGGIERLNISRIEIVNSQTTRFYFKTNVTISASLEQTVKIIDNDVVQFEGKIISSPNQIEVEAGGKNWQLGQVITIPGTSKNTIARVADIDNDGTILRVEILEYGFDHDDGETVVVSPYPVKPVGSTYDYEYNEGTNTHLLSIFDYTDGTSENIVGTNSDISPESYFLENYSLEAYVARVVIQITTVNIVPEESPDTNSPITIEEWLLSRARLRYTFKPLTTTRGKWLNSRGIISDNFIRLQDNYYYQQYSYVIESSVLRSRYQALLDNVHLAGNKSFSTYSLQQPIAIDVEINTEIPYKFIYVSDIASIEDIAYKNSTKPLSDSSNNTSDSVTKGFIKYSTDEQLTSDTITAKQVTIDEADSLDVEDSELLDVTKILDDTFVTSDDLGFDATKVLADSSTIADAVIKTPQKALSDNTDPVTDGAPLLSTVKQLTESQIISDTVISKNSSKVLNDQAIAFQLDVSSAFDLENYDSESYAEFGEPASLQAALS